MVMVEEGTTSQGFLLLCEARTGNVSQKGTSSASDGDQETARK